MRVQCDTIWRDARLLSLPSERAGLGLIEGGVLACANGRILFAGEASAAPDLDANIVHECEGRLITPGLVDCHTHLIHAGDRADEFAARLSGASYAEIAARGGGIRSTMCATRAASEEALVWAARPRLDRLKRDGVTTLEIKSGYGLTLSDELKMLRAARRLAAEGECGVSTSLLAAHAVPPEFDGRADDYISHICAEIIPEAARRGLADAVDAYCESIAFTPAQVSRVFETACAHGLRVRLHAEQLSDQGGAALAAAHNALSADHLEHLSSDGARAMGEAGVTAVLLPGAYYFLRETKRPPVELLRAHGVAMAVATDCNPGTSPLTSLLMAMNMAAVLFGLTIEECWRGVTRHAARALGLEHEIGALEAGKRCDLAIWDVETPAALIYRMGESPLHRRVRGGA